MDIIVLTNVFLCVSTYTYTHTSRVCFLGHKRKESARVPRVRAPKKPERRAGFCSSTFQKIFEGPLGPLGYRFKGVRVEGAASF